MLTGFLAHYNNFEVINELSKANNCENNKGKDISLPFDVSILFHAILVVPEGNHVCWMMSILHYRLVSFDTYQFSFFEILELEHFYHARRKNAFLCLPYDVTHNVILHPIFSLMGKTYCRWFENNRINQKALVLGWVCMSYIDYFSWGIFFRDWTTAKKMKFSIKNFFSKCNQIRSFLRSWSHLLKKFSMENFIFCAVDCFEIKD